MRIFLAVVLTAIALPLAAFGWVYLGGYDIAASSPHSDWTRQLVRSALRGAVRAHAEEVRAPSLDDPELVKEGVEHFAGNCVACHGAPGVKAGEIAAGLMPPAPDLSKTANAWSASEIFWIIKNGIQATGMPAWGKTHEDPELWAVTAFVQRLPRMSADEYAHLAPPPSVMPGTHGHGAPVHGRADADHHRAERGAGSS